MSNSKGLPPFPGPDIDQFERDMNGPRFSMPAVIIMLTLLSCIVGLVALVVFG